MKADGEFLTRLTRAETSVDKAIIARWQSGRQAPSDLIFTTWAIPVLVSERFVSILKENHFTGWKTYAVELYGKKGDPILGYHGLSIHGRCGPVSPDRANTVAKQFPGGTFLYYKGLHFDPDTWDGSDIFTPTNFGWKIVSDRLHLALTKAKINNVVFTALTDEILDPTLFGDPQVRLE